MRRGFSFVLHIDAAQLGIVEKDVRRNVAHGHYT